MLRKKRDKSLHDFTVMGVEHVHLNCKLPGGHQVVKVYIQTGSKDVDGREYVSVGVRFDENATIALSNSSNSVNLIVRMP